MVIIMVDIAKTIKKTVSQKERTNRDIYALTDIDSTAAQIWTKYATGQSSVQLLNRALANDGISLTDACSNISILDLDAAIQQKDNHWIETVDALLIKYQSRAARIGNDIGKYSIVKLCLLPFLDSLVEQLEMFHYPCIAPTVAKEYAELALSQMAFIADDTLLTCARATFNSMEITFWRDTQASPDGASFVKWFYTAGFSLVVERYPLLVKKLLAIIELQIHNYQAFALHFSQNLNSISQAFSIPSENLVLCHIVGDLSDPHQGGKSVLRLEFEDGNRIFYKPRSLTIDAAWGNFIQRLLNAGFPTGLYSPTVLDCGDYGFMQEVSYLDKLSLDDIHSYYRNAGGLCCVVSMLGGSDFHYENIIAYNTIPVLVDVETLITPMPTSTFGLTEIKKNESSCTHVGRTGMLPHWVGSTPSNAREIGGFTGSSSEGKNIPCGIGGQKKGADFYTEDFISGYASAYDFFLKNREIILSENWLSDFDSCKFRYIFRKTALYFSLNRHFYSAPFMRDVKFFEGVISRLGAGILLNFSEEDAKKLWNIVVAEKAAAQIGDIPYFYCYGNSLHLCSPSGVCVKDFFEQSPVNLARENLTGMSTVNKQQEIKFLRCSMEICALQKQNIDKTPLLSYQSIERPIIQCPKNIPAYLFAEINWLIKEIGKYETCPGSFEYYAPVRDRKTTRYNLEVLPTEIYSGSLGAIVSYAAFAALTNDETLKRSILRKIKSIYEDEFHTGKNATVLDLGYTTGLAGFVQVCLVASSLLCENSLVEMALSTALDVPEEHIDRAPHFDFFSGLAGTLYYFAKLYIAKPNALLKETIQHISAVLISRATIKEDGSHLWAGENEYQPLTGLAHGQSGVAVALLAASNVLGDNSFLRIAQELFDYESSAYSPQDNNWYDYRRFDVPLRGYEPSRQYNPRFMYGYCSGAPGIGISRIIASRLTASSLYKEDIVRAVNFCKNSYLVGNDSLCCGTGAWVDLLLEAALHFNLPELYDCAKAICLSIMPQFSGNDYILSSINGTSDMSLFKGYAGIAYQMMRCINPEKIPSIII